MPLWWPLHCGLGGQDLVQEVHSRLRLLVGSEADKWSHTAYTEQHGYVKQRCTYSALVENALYFLGDQNNGILEYSLAKKELLVIRLPPIMKTSAVVLMSVENGGGLGFAMMHDFTLCIWLGLRESALRLWVVDGHDTT